MSRQENVDYADDAFAADVTILKKELSRVNPRGTNLELWRTSGTGA